MIVFRCPHCKILNRAPNEHAGRETFCSKCLGWFKIPSESEEGTEDLDIPKTPYLRDNLFDGYSEYYGPNSYRCYEYHVFISYANVEIDRNLARGLARHCVDSGWRTFFAPETLRLENWRPDAFKSRWCDILEKGLLSSCHFAAILSPAYLASAYCDLELQGFLQIVSKNPNRSIILILNGLTEHDVPKMLKPYVCMSEGTGIKSKLIRVVNATSLRLGKIEYEPTELFSSLPISSDVWRFGFGPEKEKEKAYEMYVREYMVSILKGLDPGCVEINWPEFTTQEYKDEALQEARELISTGVMPYPLSDYQLQAPSPEEVSAYTSSSGVADGLKEMYLPPPVTSERDAFQAKIKEEQQRKEKEYTEGVRNGIIPEGPSGNWFSSHSIKYRHGHSVYCLRYGEVEEDEGPPPDSCPACGWSGR